LKIRKIAPRIGAQGIILCAALFGAPLLTQAHHVGEAVAADQQVVDASNQLLAAFAQWEKLPPSLKASNLANLVQLAQARQQSMIALVQASPKVAAARILPRQIRARMPEQAAAYVEDVVKVQGTGYINVADNFASGISRATFKILGDAGGEPQNVYRTHWRPPAAARQEEGAGAGAAGRRQHILDRHRGRGSRRGAG
jgi:hypothetical protein